ncbi:DUF5597 domain-containing protein [Dysgonomonas sp. HDW5A]|uniref:GH35 family beta-galactosidase n=1 Tax=Dysgonomonas sp. HDW5A TaxID=2714926 RepID=UPI00140A23D9|nr:DUF5597 domain-containing protein [Dysgonomonas sp. HDW5A]QIK60873.1 DUF5597 domain-containing protein [Dysgonomonas sp. HDW5A]
MRTKYIVLALFFLFTVVSQAQKTPYLQKKGTATQLIVKDNPYLILGGELGNSTASSLEDMQWVCEKLQKMKLNTMLVPAYWELIESEEGKYDYTLVDGIIELARKHDLKIVFLWFGVWKNSMSCYAPMWVKENYQKYPRAVTKSGQPLEILSAFSQNNLELDKRAFKHFMNHLAEVDKTQQTVIMVQVENEIGMIEDARDYSKEANKLFTSEVPKQLVDYLVKNKQSLRPQLLDRWEKNGFKTKGTWTELFGEGLETDEIFMAWNYGLFIQEVAQSGKNAYNLPMYLNAALNSRGRKPGAYPSAGPLAHLLDIWRASAPAIDFLAPDIYDPGFTDWCKQYHVNGNPLFIPEIRLAEENAARVFYAFGEHDTMGFSPFSIESVTNPEEYPLTKSYKILRQILPLLSEKQGEGKTNGFWFDSEQKERTIERNGYTFTFKHDYTLGWNPQAKDGNKWPETGALIIELSKNEYLVAGTGVVVTFGNTKKDGTQTGIGIIDEVEFNDGKMRPLRRMNGDQDHQGRHLRIPAGEWSIQYVKLYDYK